MAKIIHILNGPNLNLLGSREPHIYGTQTLADIEAMTRAKAADLGFDIIFAQTNHEGVLVDLIQAARTHADGVILNGAAFTHTSVAIHDALKALEKPLIEVHLSNPAARESFRATNYIAPLAKASIAGLGAKGYLVALDALADILA